MIRYLFLFSSIVLWATSLTSQERTSRIPGGGGASAAQQPNATNAQPPQKAPPHKVKSWQLYDLGSRADTVHVDTLSQGFQIHSPAYRRAMTNVQLGNLGAPWKAAMVSGMPVYSRFLFADNLSNYFTAPDEWRYYNTRTPYTNLYYQYSGPKQRSEEVVGVLFTQNINPRWNVGFDYQLISSIGKYAAQNVENRHFRFFSSYAGEKYQAHLGVVYNKTDHLENGGIIDDDYIFRPKLYDFGQTESIPVNFYTASNRIDNQQVYLNQALNIGNISVSRRDDESVKLPVGTAIYTFHLDRNKRNHRIDNLPRYYGSEMMGQYFYPNIHIDTTSTRDLLYYTSMKNTFQLRFNEEANELLRFGLRVFITNNVETFRYPLMPLVRGTLTAPPVYLQGDSTLTTTHLGGQIFKNLGEVFRWNAGMRFYFQGYRTGDSELTGAMSSSFRIAKDTASLFANAGVYLVSPGFFESQYTSNHFIWNERFNQVKTIKIRGGFAIPTRRLEVSAESRLIDDFVYWNSNAMPTQTNAVLKILELKLFKHFSLGNFHSRNTLLYQLSSNQEIVPLPEWSVYSSNYYENTLFQVLFFQLGFDIRYYTSWFAPAYMPATGQFYTQEVRKVGDYPVVDVFLNMQLKRARIFIKMDHVNEGYPSNDYFHTIGYPINPRGLRFGVSWNFYD
jgi:hypothetical protein